jgi:HEAT repeat protein
MKTWRLHLIWAVLALVSAAAWGQHVARTREIEFRERERILQVKVDQATAAVARSPITATAAAAAPVAASPAVEFPLSEKPTPEYEVLPLERPTVEEIRKMIESGDGWRAYQAIQRMVKSPIRDELTKELVRSKDAQIRRAALQLVQEALGNEAAAPIFQEVLRSDPSAEVREAAARCLGANQTAETIAALLEAFQKDEPRVQLMCAGALSNFGQPGPAAQLVPRYAAMLDSSDGALRREAVESLAQLRSPQTLPLLARALRDTNGDVRLEAVNSLNDYLDQPQVVALVEPLVDDPIAAVRDAAKDLIESAKSKKQ